MPTSQIVWTPATILTMTMLAVILGTQIGHLVNVGRRFGRFEQRQDDAAAKNAELLKAIGDYEVRTALRFKEHEAEDEARFERQNQLIDTMSGNLRELMGALRVALPDLDRRTGKSSHS